jgi:hypothetical protein
MFKRQRGISARQVVIAVAFVGRNVPSLSRARSMGTLTGHRITHLTHCDTAPHCSLPIVSLLVVAIERTTRTKPMMHTRATITYSLDHFRLNHRPAVFACKPDDGLGDRWKAVDEPQTQDVARR